MVNFRILTQTTEAQNQLIEKLALAISKGDELSAAILLTEITNSGLRVEKDDGQDLENKSTISTSIEQ